MGPPWERPSLLVRKAVSGAPYSRRNTEIDGTRSNSLHMFVGRRLTHRALSLSLSLSPCAYLLTRAFMTACQRWMGMSPMDGPPSQRRDPQQVWIGSSNSEATPAPHRPGRDEPLFVETPRVTGTNNGQSGYSSFLFPPDARTKMPVPRQQTLVPIATQHHACSCKNFTRYSAPGRYIPVSLQALCPKRQSASR
jgi:hypothetical protein